MNSGEKMGTQPELVPARNMDGAQTPIGIPPVVKQKTNDKDLDDYFVSYLSVSEPKRWNLTGNRLDHGISSIIRNGPSGQESMDR